MFTKIDLENIFEEQVHCQINCLFIDEVNISNDLIKLIQENAKDLSLLIDKMKKNQIFQDFLYEVTKKTIKNWLKENQFLNFSYHHEGLLQDLYGLLLNEIHGLCMDLVSIPDESIELIFQNHHEKLKLFLIKSNGNEIFKKYKTNTSKLEITCEEYSRTFQEQQLNLSQLLEPVLDIGCGEKAILVHHLREMGIEAYGMDRNVEDDQFLMNLNWLDYSFQSNTYGTIISHMAFSNHFIHHHLRIDGEFTKYAQKYMEILKALKVNGRFYYSPRLPFIEDLLASSEFQVQSDDYSTCIVRIA